MSDYFKDLPEELKKYIPDFEFELITIKGIPDKDILKLDKNNILRGMLLMFKHLGEDDFMKQNFPEFFTFLELNPNLYRYLQVYYEYMSRHTAMEAEEFHELADDFFESHYKPVAMTTYDKIVLKGTQEQIKKFVRNGLLRGASLLEIADWTDLSLEETARIIQEIEKEKIGE